MSGDNLSRREVITLAGFDSLDDLQMVMEDFIEPSCLVVTGGLTAQAHSGWGGSFLVIPDDEPRYYQQLAD